MSVINGLPQVGGKVIVETATYQIYRSGNVIILNLTGAEASDVNIPAGILPPTRIIGVGMVLDANRRYLGYISVYNTLQSTGTYCTMAYAPNYGNTALTSNVGAIWGQAVWAIV